MSPHRPTTRRGYTLIELSLSLGIMALLGIAMASAIVLCARAVPGNGGSVSPSDADDATAQAARAQQQIAGELHYAIDVTEASPTAVTFTVADRDGDGAPERVRYAWSGKEGASLTRQYNNGPADEVLANVKEFDLSYVRRAVSRTQTTITQGTTPELLLAFFNTYASGTVTDKTMTLSTTGNVSERFFLDATVVPADTKKVTFTRAKVWMKGGGLLGVAETASLQLVAPAGGGSVAPGSGALGPATVLSVSALPSSYNWVEWPISGTTTTNPSQDICLVLRGGPLGGASVQYKFNNKGPSDTQVMQWSTDGGLSWGPTSAGLQSQQDLRFYLYGTCATSTTTQTTVTDYYLTGVGVRIRLGADGAGTVYTSVTTPEHPRVSGP